MAEHGYRIEPAKIVGESDVLDLTLSVPAEAVDDNDVLADTQEVADAFRLPGGSLILNSLLVLDEDDQGVEMDVILLDSNVSIGTEDAAVSVSDANARSIIGHVNVAGADYVDMINSQFAMKANLGMVLKAAAGSTSLYVAVVTRGTPTHTASGLKLKLGVLRD